MMTEQPVPDPGAILRKLRDLLELVGEQRVDSGFRDVTFDTRFELKQGDRVYPVFLVTARAG